jgi:hypothetical protein
MTALQPHGGEQPLAIRQRPAELAGYDDPDATVDLACSHCGAPLEAHFTRGGLVAYSSPPRIYHRGTHLVLSPMQARIMLLLVRFGSVPFETLAALSKVNSLQGIFVVTTNLRKRLPSGVRIVTARGWGYILDQSESADDQS